MGASCARSNVRPSVHAAMSYGPRYAVIGPLYAHKGHGEERYGLVCSSRHVSFRSSVHVTRFVTPWVTHTQDTHIRAYICSNTFLSLCVWCKVLTILNPGKCITMRPVV